MLTKISLSFLLLASAANAAQKCKCLPGDSCFPDDATWDAFAKNLSQPLIANQRPLAASCYEASANFNADTCTSLRAQSTSHDLLAAASNALQWVNWEELITNTTYETCVFDPAPNATCSQGRVPSYSVNVSTVEDVQATIRFAATHNLHLVVKNAGHENLGRMFGVGSVELFVHDLQEYNFSDSFIPEGAPEGTAGQTAVTIQPGVQWGNLYALADAANHTVAGGIGAGGTVGAGAGWPLGGGHSILSPYYGLGVDNALEFKVVLPNASYVTANNYQNTDLFWALRGGGGPSFGVVLEMTYRTHPNPPYTAVFYAATASSNESFIQIFETFNKHHNAILDSGWAGFWPWSNQTFYLTLITPGTPPTNASANATLEAFYADVNELEGVDVNLTLTVNYTTFNHWYHNNFIDSSLGFGFNYSQGDAGGIRVAVSSFLVPRDLFDTNPTELAQAWANMPAGRPFMVGGGAVAAGDPNSAAACPAWRRTGTDMTVANEWAEGATFEEIQAVRQGVYDQIQPLRELAPYPIGGQYLNEADYLEEDWQLAYWGDNYPRLLALKKEVDPNDLFIVYKGVNSEDWDENVVCKTI